MTHTTFKISNATPKYNFRNTTDYSKTLDDLIAANIIDSNPYLKKFLKKKEDDEFIDNMMAKSKSKIDCTEIDKFIKAANFLSNYKKPSPKKAYFEIGKLYKIGSTPIIFFDDEIQIGLDLYSYDDFKKKTFIDSLPDTTKKIIINIFININ